MRYVMCLLLLLIYTSVLAAEEQKFFYEGELYYNCVARQNHTYAISLIESGAGLGFKYQNNPFTIKLNSKTGFSLPSGYYVEKMGYKGTLNAEFGYFIPKRWEPFIFSFNEYDPLTLLYWRSYTGIGIHMTAYNNDPFKLVFSVGPILQYENFLEDRIFDHEEREKFILSYYLQGQLVYSFLKRVKLQLMWRAIPVYNFSKLRFTSEIAVIVSLFRKKSSLFNEEPDRKIGADYVMRISADVFSKSPTSAKKADVIFSSGIKFFL